MSGFRVRRADPGDADVLAAHRVAMLTDMRLLAAGSPLVEEIVGSSRGMIAAALTDGTWAAWVAEDAHGVVGGGAAILRTAPPSARLPRGGPVAYLLNVYTEPRARRRGVATAVVEACLAWCRGQGIARVGLHASDAARSLYERLGFVLRPNEMELDLLAGRADLA